MTKRDLEAGGTVFWTFVLGARNLTGAQFFSDMFDVRPNTLFSDVFKSSLVSAVLQPELVIKTDFETALAPCSHLQPFPRRLFRCVLCFAMVSGNLDTIMNNQ